MKPKSAKVDETSESTVPLGNQAAYWLEEDIEIEGRKPDLGEIEGDTAEIDNTP